MRRSPALLPVILLSLAVLMIACSRPEREKPDDPFDGPPLTEPDAIRQFEFATSSTVQAGGQLTNTTPDIAALIYADVTGDGQEEAIIPFSTGGSQGYVFYQVYRINRTGPELVLSRNADRNSVGGIRMTVPDGVLTETTGVFANEDPLCCPSQLKQTTFKWDGTRLAVATENVVANPNAPKS